MTNMKETTQKFMVKTMERTLMKLVDIAILFGIGYALGLKLVRVN